MAVWSAWQRFPDFKAEGYPEAPDGPGVYELRNRSTGDLILVGESNTLAKRMKSLLPESHGGRGKRNNSAKREYVAQRLPDVEYRTFGCTTKAEARKLERQLLDTRTYIFPT